MFYHNYKYRLKCIIRDKQLMFWTLLFPIILATLFNLAFSNITTAVKFSKIKIGIVNNAEYYKNTDFIKVISSISNNHKNEGKDDLFDIKYVSKIDADKLLDDGKIEGYINFDNGIKLVINKSGLNQTILKGFLDDFEQSASTGGTIASKNRAAIQNGLMDSISDRNDYLKEVSSSRSAPNNTLNYFFALIAMACLYGSFWGLKEVVAIQANQSTQGARVNMAPTHKMKVFFASMSAAFTVQFLEILVLIGYLTSILKIDFGNQVGYVLLTCAIATITGVLFGAFFASIIKNGEGIKIGVLISLSMAMSFLSGLMVDKMKYIISSNAPIIGYLNPANLITDSFYALYYYDTHTQFFKDILMLCGFSIIFCLSTYFVLRRQKYASL
ncbi:MAG: ABC transporter permease [Bacillota bacterium]|nr:ABC transporter permease [Bacillota bacterium]